MINAFKKLFNLFFGKSEPEVTPTPRVTITLPPKPLPAKDRFQKELDKRNIKHFTADEVFYKGASDKKLGLNTEPPENL